MARSKPALPRGREVSLGSGNNTEGRSNMVTKGGAVDEKLSGRNGYASSPAAAVARKEAGLVTLIIDVAGIYASFLTWAYLQEKLTTTAYGSAGERFKFPIFLLTIQSLFAAVGGLIFTWASTPKGQTAPSMIPRQAMLPSLLLVATTNALAAPFGYAALAHIDYITFILAKSCKLLPVMFLHVTLFGRRYPRWKYGVVLAVTAGVAVFTLHSGSKKKHKSSPAGSGQTWWGLVLLAVNLLFDGLTNTTQDHIFQTYQPYSGPQMMAANNALSSLLTGGYLLLSPWLVRTRVGIWLGMPAATGSEGELAAALSFLARHPAVWKDVLGFAACGCVGQVFIFHTLSTFSSVLLVTVTVTRKMFTMILSVVAFGHRLSGMQWLGVGLVFSGIGVEAHIARREKMLKDAAAKIRQEKGR